MRQARAVSAVLVLLLFAIPSMGKEPPAVKDQAAWKEIDRLISEHKLQEASIRLDELLPELRKAGDDAWMRGLVRGAQLRVNIAAPEEAVRFLKSQPWPEGRRERAVLSLFQAQALKAYYDNYRWEIWRREAIESKDPADLAKWTAGQVFEAASQAYLDVWQDREALGKVPVSELSEFLEPNNYPRDIRGTLRDTLSYLWVDLLTDTGYWSPRQSNATGHFDLAAVFRGENDPGPEQLADPGVHPLLRAMTVLADLERWHRSEGRLGGALEARLERMRRLRQHGVGSDLEALEKELAALLPEYRKVPWWSMGMAELAEIHRSQGELVQAREAAREGEAAYPGTPGAKAGEAIAGEIETPEYRVAVTATDALARRSIEVFHKNLPALWFRAYPIDLEERLRTSGPIFPDRGDVFLKNRQPAFTWKAELPATPDYQVHRTYLTPPIDRPGAYLLMVSARRDFSEKENVIASTPFILGGVVLLVRDPRDGKGLEVTALDGERGEPVPGAAVSLYRVESWERREREAVGTTDGQGRLRLDLDGRQGYALIARRGEEIGFLQSYFHWEPEADQDVRSLVFTDRSIYRPNQKVLWKVLAYQNQGEEPRQAANTSLTVSLVDPNNQAVESRTVRTNDFGTASGEFVVPPGRPLGNWRVETSRPGMASIRVEEYKRPTFEVSLQDPAEPLRLGRPATFTGEGRYYFGLPVTQGEVTWRVVRQSFSWWGFYDSPSDEETVATGTATPDAEGRFTVTFTPDPGDPKGRDVRQLTYRYRVTADLTDEGGETRTAERSFRLGWVSIEAEIVPKSRLLTAGKPGSVTIQRRDLDGIGRAGEGAWSLVSLEQPAETPAPADLPVPVTEGAFLTDGDRLRSRARPEYGPRAVLAGWEDGPEVASGTVRHGKDGEAELTFPGLAPGAYRLRYETADESGETFWTTAELIVAGAGTHLALPAVLEVDDSEARPGGRIRVLAHSGFADQLVWLETWRGGRRVREIPLRMGRDSSLIEIPIGKEDRGGFSLKLSTLRDFQLVELTADVRVPWDDRRLEIETATFRDRIRPGGRETWTVKIRPAEGASEAAMAGVTELLASMYDRSLDLFAPHRPPDPLSLYPNRIGAPAVTSSLGERFAGWVGGTGLQRYYPGADLRKDELRYLGAYSLYDEAMTFAAAESIEGGVEGGIVGGVVGGVPAPPPPPPPVPHPQMAAADINMLTKRETAQEGQPEVELRSEFAETAFWEPHLLTDKDGTAAIEFTVPDSVTSWNFWVQAVTRDLRAGSLKKEVRTVKDLMVRPYLPRFLREGDRAELQVVVNNASDGPLSGEVVIDILEPGTDRSRLADFGVAQARARFTAQAGGGATVRFPLTTPPGVGSVAFKVTAVAGAASDGELRVLPVLPSRMHLAQSRFVSLQGGNTREMRFDDMTKPDTTRIDEQLVVTLDAQLFQGVLAALPYLVNYPYECTEQTLNRFLSTGIVSRLFDRYPAVAAMAKDFSKRETQFETWDAVDPNRKMALEETPWLETAQGGKDQKDPLINVLDERVARAQRDEALMKLRQAQLSSGAFPWFPGGPPSPHMTLYLLYGFAKATESGIDVPRDMIENGWRYIAGFYRREAKPGEEDRELLVFLNYVASAYPDPSWMGEGGLTPKERKEILDDSFAHWRELSGYLKVLLALTLKRMDRPADARLVFGAVLDLAKTTENEGTFWAPEPRAWLWYNDTIETHAFALLALMEIAPEDPRRHGLVQWLFLNKHLNHWKSTRATAEVIYALVHYLEKEGTLAVREEAAVRVGGQTTTFVFEPDRYTGKHNQVVLPGGKIDPETASRVVVENRGPNLMFASATWHFSTEELPQEARGDLFGVTRRYFLRMGTGESFVLKPLEEGAVLKPGDEVEVQLTISSRAPAEYVHLRDPRPAGLEPGAARSGYKWDILGRYEEVRDSGTNFFFDWLPAGQYTLSYRVRANMGGTFRTGPATLQSMYAPELTAYSAGDVVTVAPVAP